MTLFKKLFGLAPSDRKAPDTAGADPVPTSAPDPTAFVRARDWLKAASGHDGVWRDLGELRFAGGGMFVGDPTCGHDYHMQHSSPVAADSVNVWVLESGPAHPAFSPHSNMLIWLEALGTPPATRGAALEFGVDAACLAIGDIDTGHAFTRLTDLELDAGRGDSFEWIMPHIQAQPHFARWLGIPPDDHRMLIASTGNDGGFAAVWLHDAQEGLSGILIDIVGRAGDAMFLDKLLSPRVGQAS